MQAADIPSKFPIPFAENALSGDIRPIPETTADPEAASLDAGFPPDTFTPVGAGGSPPDGRDFNGLFKQITQWSQWQNAGGTVPYDPTFQTAIGGYPAGALVASAISIGVFWLCLADDNTTDPDAGGAGWQGFNFNVPPGTGCRIAFSTTSSIALLPVEGGLLWINGFNYQVPAALTLSNSGLGTSVARYVYAYMNSGVMTLEGSATGYTFAANGIPQKAGDATRTLVGMTYLNSSGLFTNSPLLNISRFCRRTLSIQSGTVASSTASAVLVEITNSSTRIPFLTWDDNAVSLLMAGYCSNDTTNKGFGATLAIDGISIGSYSSTGTLVGNAASAAGSIYQALIVEGFHNGGIALSAPNGNTAAISAQFSVTISG